MPLRPAGEHWPAFVLTALIAAATTFLLGDLMWQLTENGPFEWHLSRDATWQGGLEVLALALLLALIAGSVKHPRWRMLLLVAIGELYLRRHYVDLPLLVDVAYIEILIGLGAAAARGCGLPPARDLRGYIALAIAGVVLWSLGAWTLSAFGFGSLKILRIYTVLLALPAIAARRTPLSVFLWRRFAALDASQRACGGALAAWFLCLAARTNVMGGYDAWWYGLRGDYVLVAGGSVFKPLDLVAPVHYYPKLFELLLIPVTGLHDISVIEGVSILVLGLFAMTCMTLLKTFELGFRVRLLLTALCVTVPAIANAALSPKPDLFAAWVLLFACIEAQRFARTGSMAAVLWTGIACALAFSSKLSAPPFILALLAITLFVWFRNRRPRASDLAAERRFAVSIACAAFLVAILVTMRTWLLAGAPLVAPQQVVELLAALGMPLKAPVGVLLAGPPVDWRSLPALLADQLFRPQKLAHMVISWIGNVWLYLFVLAFAARVLVRRTRDAQCDDARVRVPVIWTIVLVTGLVLLATFRNGERGGDGNYFVLPVALAIMIGGYAALKRLPAGLSTRMLLATLPLFVLFQASYSFLSADWSAGTRAFDFDLMRSVRDLRRQNRQIFERVGIAGIADDLRAVRGIARAVGYVADGTAFRLPATFETLNFYEYWYRPPLRSVDTFIAYLQDHRIDYLVMPKTGTQVGHPLNTVVVDAAQRLRAMPDVRIVTDRSYVLYDLAALHADLARAKH